MHDLHIACGQFVAEPGAKRANIARMIRYAAEARAQGCDLVLFPELIVTGYLAPEQVAPLAEPIDGPSVRRLAEAADDLGVAMAFGLAELDARRDVRYNSLVVIDRRGQVVAVYHKIHLWDQEKQWAEAGTGLPVFEIAGVRCSGWICYDTRFPELARMAALSGADVGLVATAWLGPVDEWELALRARALDNSIYVAGADIINPDPALRCQGASMIVGPRGHVLARAELEREGIVHAVLKESALEAQRKRVPLLQERRPEVYGRVEG
jgi:predicted amidohydrolase